MAKHAAGKHTRRKATKRMDHGSGPQTGSEAARAQSASKKGRGRGVIIAVVALVLVLATGAGVAFGWPYIQRTFLSGAPSSTARSAQTSEDSSLPNGIDGSGAQQELATAGALSEGAASASVATQADGAASAPAGTSAPEASAASPTLDDPTSASSSDKSVTDSESAVAVGVESAASKVKTNQEPVRIGVMMLGDILMHDPVIYSGAQEDGSYSYDHLFEPIRSYIDAADIRILNQETVMSYPEVGYDMSMAGEGGPLFNTPTGLADTEARYGFNVILKATNHTFDQGFDGLGHELDYWHSTYPAIPVVGVSNPHAPDDASQDWVHNVYVYEKDGFKVGILNHTFGTNENPDYELDYQYCSYLYEEKIRADYQMARDAGADIVIACPHWGIEYETEPSDEEYEFSKLYCELGCELIIGAHPHILQRCETLRSADGNKTVCFYSLGNYVATWLPASSLISGIARATLVKDAEGARVEAASFVPTVTVYASGPDMTSWPIKDYDYDRYALNAMGELTPEYAQDFVAEVFGPGYSYEAGEYYHDMEAEGRLV